MALRQAAILALAVHAALADPGHLRGLRTNRTANATPEAVLPQSMGNSTFSKMTEAELLETGVNSTLDTVTEGELLPWLPPALQAADNASEVEAMPGNRTMRSALAGSGNIMTLYHTTSSRVADIIVNTQHFKPGSSGFCGGAIYFMNTPNIPATKVPNPDGTHRQAVLEARVDMGNMAVINGLCLGWQWARMFGYDTITFNPWDGQEFVVFDPSRVLSVRRYK
uniref:Uncharacterized protein n=1 Tax=Strombidinopsis acuminata TaxID=141414 RepID=A0A7S3S1U7_9SPIT|mmetsp:Transcript_57462/g.147765  ORF Transcript_57462/g.147765 Transcript_57462/m.147765 type:complete len:224 (-) Transcript_57462:403-1074(-)